MSNTQKLPFYETTDKGIKNEARNAVKAHAIQRMRDRVAELREKMEHPEERQQLEAKIAKYEAEAETTGKD